MARFFCWLLGHRPWGNVDPAMCLVYHCRRCQSLVLGGLASYRRK